MKDRGDGSDGVKKRDPITQPKHYTLGKIETVEAIQLLGLDYAAGNCVKYLCRFTAKNGKEDLLKARQYITLMIENYGNWYGDDKDGDNS